MFTRISAVLASMWIASASIQDCSKGTSIFQPTKLSISPESPKPGDIFAMTVEFNNPGLEITDGTVTTSVIYNYIPFDPTVEALCTNTQCPLVTGFNDRSTSSTWPSVSGIINTRIEWTDAEGKQLLCIEMDIITSSSSYLRGAINKSTEVSDITPLLEVVRTQKGSVQECPAIDWFKTFGGGLLLNASGFGERYGSDAGDADFEESVFDSFPNKSLALVVYNQTHSFQNTSKFPEAS